MSSWYKKRKKYPQTPKVAIEAQSLGSLKAKITKNQNRLNKIENLYNQVVKDLQKNKKIEDERWAKNNKLSESANQIKNLRNTAKYKYYFWTNSKNEIDEKIQEIEKKMVPYETLSSHSIDEFEKFLGWFNSKEELDKKINEKKPLFKSEIIIAKSEIERRKKGDSTINELESYKAAYLGKSRDLAAKIKSQLKKLNKCPYCGGSLGVNPEADHIYPVSKGGLSTHKNLIYVCKSCNSKKSSLTLNQFIKKYDLNKEFIERNLDKLNKEW